MLYYIEVVPKEITDQPLCSVKPGERKKKSKEKL